MPRPDPDDLDRALLKVRQLVAAALKVTKERGVDEPDPELSRPSDYAITEMDKPLGINEWGKLLTNLRANFEGWEDLVRVLARAYAMLAVRRVVSREVAEQGIEELRLFSRRLENLEWTLKRMAERG